MFIYLVFYHCSSSSSNHELLLNVLWEGVVHTSAQVRATAARMFEVCIQFFSTLLGLPYLCNNTVGFSLSSTVKKSRLILQNHPKILIIFPDGSEYLNSIEREQTFSDSLIT